MNEAGACKLCRSDGSVIIRKGVRLGPRIEVRRCTGCGLVFLRPRPDEGNLDNYYTEHYRDEYSEPPVEERYRTDLDEARIRVRRLQDYLTPHVRLLEVGCGSGAFLDAVRPYVGEVVGVEPDAASRAWIEDKLGIKALKELPRNKDDIPPFDLIVSFHLIEHIPDPVAFLVKQGEFLRSEGRLMAEVPNVDDALVSSYRIPSYLEFYYQKVHLYYFSGDTLESAFKQAGYDVVIEGIQRYDLGNHIHWMLTGEPGGRGSDYDFLGPAVNAAYADSLIRSGRSDTLWAVAHRAK